MKRRVPVSDPCPPHRAKSRSPRGRTGTKTAPTWRADMREVLDAFRAEQPRLAQLEGRGVGR
jgi:hypothetical protein